MVGTLTSDLSKIPKDKFEVAQSTKGSYYKIWYSVEMRFEAMITFRLLFDGTSPPQRARPACSLFLLRSRLNTDLSTRWQGRSLGRFSSIIATLDSPGYRLEGGEY